MYQKPILNKSDRLGVKRMDMLLQRAIFSAAAAALKNQGYSANSLKSGLRNREAVTIRLIVAYYLSKRLKLNKSQIARLMSKHHTSITYALEKAGMMVEFYKDRKALDILEELNKLELTYLINIY